MTNDDLQNSKLYIFGSYLWLFMVASLWFFIFNIPFLIALAFHTSVKSGFTGIIMVLISSFTGPSIIAMFYTMNKAYRDKELDNTTRNFLKGYKTNFFEGIFYWCIFLIIYIGLYFYQFHFQAAAVSQKWLVYLFMLLQMLLLTIAIMNFVIVSKFYLNIKSALRISIYQSIKNIKLFAQIFGVIIIYTIALKYLGNFIFLFISVIAYSIIIILDPVLKNIEAEFNSKNEN